MGGPNSSGPSGVSLNKRTMDNLVILSALAKIRDIQDFRLRDFMSSLGLDEKQPSTFYRKLLRESRDAIRLIGDLQNRLDASEDVICELETNMSTVETNVSTQQRQIADLKTKMSSLENGNRQRIKEVESEKHQLKAIASVLRERAQNYEGIKDFLRARIDIRGLRALCDLVSAMYSNALAARLGGKPEVEPADLDRLAPIRERLREDLMGVLQIPRDVLEERLIEAEKINEAFKSLVNQMFGRKG